MRKFPSESFCFLTEIGSEGVVSDLGNVNRVGKGELTCHTEGPQEARPVTMTVCFSPAAECRCGVGRVGFDQG